MLRPYFSAPSGSLTRVRFSAPRAGPHLRRLPDFDLARLGHQEQTENERDRGHDDRIDQRRADPCFQIRGGRDDWDQATTPPVPDVIDRKSTRLNSSHGYTSYAAFSFKKKRNHGIASYRPMTPSRVSGRAPVCTPT